MILSLRVTKGNYTITSRKKSFGMLTLNQTVPSTAVSLRPASTPLMHGSGNTWTKGILRPCCDQTAGGWDDSETLSTQTRPDQSFFMWYTEQSDESV